MQIPCANVYWICIEHEMVYWTLNPSLNIEWFIEYWIKHWMLNMHWILIESLNWIKICVLKWIGNQFWTLLQMLCHCLQKISLAILFIFSFAPCNLCGYCFCSFIWRAQVKLFSVNTVWIQSVSACQFTFSWEEWI